jgi:hypothetical protein
MLLCRDDELYSTTTTMVTIIHKTTTVLTLKSRLGKLKAILTMVS